MQIRGEVALKIKRSGHGAVPYVDGMKSLVV